VTKIYSKYNNESNTRRQAKVIKGGPRGSNNTYDVCTALTYTSFITDIYQQVVSSEHHLYSVTYNSNISLIQRTHTEWNGTVPHEHGMLMLLQSFPP